MLISVGKGKEMSKPTWVDGIAPPLEQIAEDCREALTLPGTEPQSFQDVLALIAEVKRLRAEPTTGAELIAAERLRQITAEGYSPEHDDEHGLAELAMAAACYALPEIRVVWWPWDDRDWKPSDDSRVSQRIGEGRVRELVKAGALVAAEIDRLTRAALEGAPDA